MQMPVRSGKIALQSGTIVGTALGFGQLVLLFLLAAIGSVGLGFVLDTILSLAAMVLVGVWASKRSGKVATGTLAGLWAGGSNFVVFYVILFLFFLTLDRASFMNGFTHGAGDSAQAYSSAVGVVVFLFVILLPTSIGVGAGLGALGGLIGKSSSPVQQMAYAFPPPAAPYPPYPPQQSYSPPPDPYSPYPPQQPYQSYPSSPPYSPSPSTNYSRQPYGQPPPYPPSYPPSE